MTLIQKSICSFFMFSNMVNDLKITNIKWGVKIYCISYMYTNMTYKTIALVTQGKIQNA